MCTVGDDDEWVCGFLRLEERGWVGRRGVNGVDCKGLGFGVWGLTGGIRLLSARANQRLLGKGWPGIGRVKGGGWPGG